MSESYAVRIFDSLADLAVGRKPRHGRIWGKELYLGRGDLPASRNKFKGENGIELLDALDRRDFRRVDEILDWWCWYRTTPFTDGEDLTCEEAYRTLMAYPDLLAFGVAIERQHTAAIAACGELAAAHFGWLLAGIGGGPGRRVLDHQHGARGGVVLVGEGKPLTGLPYVVQPGLRGWIRGDSGDFLFAERTGLSIMVAQGLGRPVKRGLAASQVDIFDGFRRRWPSAPAWGIPDAGVAQAFAANPADVAHANQLVRWLLPPSLPGRFDRFEDISVVGLLEADSPSSTDPCIIDAWYAGGETRKASCEDGRRSSVSRQVGAEETSAYVARFANGSGQPVRVHKPTAREAHSIRCDGRQVWLEFGDGQRPAVPVTPPPDQPQPPAPKPRRRRRFNFS